MLQPCRRCSSCHGYDKATAAAGADEICTPTTDFFLTKSLHYDSRTLQRDKTDVLTCFHLQVDAYPKLPFDLRIDICRPITRSFLDSLIESPAAGLAPRGDRKNGSAT